ncbi:MAG TPA: M48 family metallopeptidase [Rhodocyclaceae bacterium]
MSTPIAVDYYDGHSARRNRARLDYVDGHWRIRGDFGERLLPRAEATISEPLGQASRSLRWPDGAHCEIADHAGFDQLLQVAGVRATPVVALQSRWLWAIGALAGFIVIVAFTYVSLLPWAAEHLAQRIPDSAVDSLSREILKSMDQHVLQPSKLDEARQQALRERFSALPLPGKAIDHQRVHFRASKRLPPNAFALPSGDIVVFDSLVKLAASDDEVIAVLAHEAGHVAQRHGLRQMLQTTVVSTVITVYFGDISALATGVGALLLESRYSREFERDADDYAADALLAAGKSPELLATMLEKLERSRRGKSADSAPGVDLLATHPDTAERTAALRARAGR